MSAKKSNLVNDIYVVSDNDETIKLSKKIGAKAPFKRPKNLSEEYILINDILKSDTLLMSFIILKTLLTSSLCPGSIIQFTPNFILLSVVGTYLQKSLRF